MRDFKMTTDEKRFVGRMRLAERVMPRGYILIARVDGSGLYLFDKHPEDGGKEIAQFPKLKVDHITT